MDPSGRRRTSRAGWVSRAQAWGGAALAATGGLMMLFTDGTLSAAGVGVDRICPRGWRRQAASAGSVGRAAGRAACVGCGRRGDAGCVGGFCRWAARGRAGPAARRVMCGLRPAVTQAASAGSLGGRRPGRAGPAARTWRSRVAQQAPAAGVGWRGGVAWVCGRPAGGGPPCEFCRGAGCGWAEAPGRWSVGWRRRDVSWRRRAARAAIGRLAGAGGGSRGSSPRCPSGCPRCRGTTRPVRPTPCSDSSPGSRRPRPP